MFQPDTRRWKLLSAQRHFKINISGLMEWAGGVAALPCRGRAGRERVDSGLVERSWTLGVKAEPSFHFLKLLMHPPSTLYRTLP